MLTTDETRTHLEQLVAAAIRAPSGDNTQPWKFVIEPQAGQILIHLDESRDRSPMNSDQRMSRIAVGTAAENLRRTCQSNGIQTELNCDRDSCRISIISEAGDFAIQPDPVIAKRVTNRRPYDAREVTPVIPNALEKVATSGGVTTRWITRAEERQELGKLIVRGDRLLFGSPNLREAFFKNVRFDCPPEEEVDWGLSFASMELSGGELRAFRTLPKLPSWLLQILRIGNTFAKGSRKLVESASGFCLGLAPDDEPTTDLHVGMGMERAWLALTEQDLAVQPMMSLLVLDNIRQHGDDALQKAIGIPKLNALCQDFRQFTQTLGEGRPAFLLRFGYAPPPSGRCGRLPPQVDYRD